MDTMRTSVFELSWHHLYSESWKNEIVPAAFQHPAKYSRALIRHIYEYLIKEKMVKPEDVVLDPFGGVALGGLDAARLGLHFIGFELEEKFVTLGNQNIALWNSRYAGKMPRWGSARLVQGDSRHLRDVITQASAAVSSPPYAGSPLTYEKNGLLEDGKRPYKRDYMKGNSENYGGNPANLGNLPKGDYRAAISSPPYADGCAHNGGDDPHPEHIQGGEYHGVGIQGAVSSPPYNLPMSQDHNGTRGGKRGTTPAEQGAFVKYGNTDGQIEGLPMSEEGFNAAVSSPPFEQQNSGGGIAATLRGEGDYHSDSVTATIGRKNQGYQNQSADSDNLGNNRGDDFWSAARQVVAETYAVLAPGAVAVWVVKDFIRNKTRVPFCDQWRQLCEACGFSTYAIARAWLVEDHGTQLAMDGNHKHKRTERKSFFRRLAERKGSPRIDFETVLIMRKPEAAP